MQSQHVVYILHPQPFSHSFHQSLRWGILFFIALHFVLRQPQNIASNALALLPHTHSSAHRSLSCLRSANLNEIILPRCCAHIKCSPCRGAPASAGVCVCVRSQFAHTIAHSAHHDIMYVCVAVCVCVSAVSCRLPRGQTSAPNQHTRHHVVCVCVCVLPSSCRADHRAITILCTEIARIRGALNGTRRRVSVSRAIVQRLNHRHPPSTFPI